MLQIGIQPEGERKNDTGESVFPEIDPFPSFSGLVIYFLLYIGMNTESRGGQQTWPLSESDLTLSQLYKGLMSFIIL